MKNTFTEKENGEEQQKNIETKKKEEKALTL